MSPTTSPIAAVRTIGAERERAFEFLSNLDNHWLLADRFVEVLDVDAAAASTRNGNGRVRIKGPLGAGRTVATRVLDVESPRRISGLAQVGRVTVAQVTWKLEHAERGVRVRLVAEVERAGTLDRLLLAAGGRRWLHARFEAVLARLDSVLRQG
ncbi:MAG: SRPBCC family protein [Solirubrobacterales bacterium]